MLKKVVRLGILMMLVLILGFGSAGTQFAKASSSATPVQTAYSFGDVYGIPWNGSYDSSSWDASNMYWLDFETSATTFGELQAEYENLLGYRTVILARIPEFEGEPTLLAPTLVGPPSADIYIKPDPSDLLSDHFWGPGSVYLAIFKAPDSSENVRLTLFGYVNDDNKSCVLWSLDGSRPVNVDSKCGGGSELVCTVKLVEKKLKYNCDGGYDWLGEQIVRDPQWLAWADKFASMNGKK
jgi:hypothetical protein